MIFHCMIKLIVALHRVEMVPIDRRRKGFGMAIYLFSFNTPLIAFLPLCVPDTKSGFLESSR